MLAPAADRMSPDLIEILQLIYLLAGAPNYLVVIKPRIKVSR